MDTPKVEPSQTLDSTPIEADDPPPDWMLRAGHRSFGDKMASGCRGFKYAIRSDSSFFALGYRGLLIILAAALLGVGPFNWCLFAIAACLVLMAELFQAAIQAVSNSLPNPDDPGAKAARDMAVAASLVADAVAITLAFTILVIKFGDLMNWWGNKPT